MSTIDSNQPSGGVSIESSNDTFTKDAEAIPGKQSFDRLIGCVKAWTSLDEDDGLSSYSEMQEEDVPWLYDAYINQYKKH